MKPISNDSINKTKQQHLEIRKSLSKRPFLTSKYFLLSVFDGFVELKNQIYKRLFALSFVILVFSVLFAFYKNNGSQNSVVILLEQNFIWFGYWTILGIASSIGLGTGLHTFLLFLGPHIVKVVITAYTCHSLDFLVFGEGQFICKSNLPVNFNLWDLFKKTFPASFFWGFGTSIGFLFNQRRATSIFCSKSSCTCW